MSVSRASHRGGVGYGKGLALSLGSLTHVGMKRSNNQDAFCALAGPDAPHGFDALLAVADGMGGHKAGEVASAMSIQGLVSLLSPQSSGTISPVRPGGYDSNLEDVLTPEPSDSTAPAVIEIPHESTQVVYRDTRYPASWDGQLDYIVQGLASKGYQIVDAEQLRDYMAGNDVDTCVVFAQDVVPHTVLDDHTAPSSASLIREYMERGGRVVWFKDVPFFYVGLQDSERIGIGDTGQTAVLGIRPDLDNFDQRDEVTITGFGAEWGLTQTWNSMRPTADSGENLAVQSDSGNSAAYYINMGGPPLSGFVRIWDTIEGDFVTPEHLDDLDRICQYNGAPAEETGPLFPANGHSYEVVRGGILLTWPQAKELAESMVLDGVRGHLATITSREENDWIVANTDLGSDHVWIGGASRYPTADPIRTGAG